MNSPLDTLACFLVQQSLLFLNNAVCLAEKQQVQNIFWLKNITIVLVYNNYVFPVFMSNTK